jgi:membrane-associated protease RseP (regulator of RpoE activity)
MSEQTEEKRNQGWKWIALLLIAMLVLSLTCVTSTIWGGVIGFALGRATNRPMPMQMFPYDVEPFEPPMRPMPDIPEMPEMPDRPEMPEMGDMPWLGVTFVIVDDGARVNYVVPNSPADDAGLEAGDIITEVNGRNVTESNPLDELIQRYDPGDWVELTVNRNGRERMIEVRLASRNEF